MEGRSIALVEKFFEGLRAEVKDQRSNLSFVADYEEVALGLGGEWLEQIILFYPEFIGFFDRYPPIIDCPSNDVCCQLHSSLISSNRLQITAESAGNGGEKRDSKPKFWRLSFPLIAKL